LSILSNNSEAVSLSFGFLDISLRVLSIDG